MDIEKQQPGWGSPGVGRAIVAALGPLVIIWGLVAAVVMLAALIIYDEMIEPYWTEAWKTPAAPKRGRAKAAAEWAREVQADMESQGNAANPAYRRLYPSQHGGTGSRRV